MRWNATTDIKPLCIFTYCSWKVWRNMAVCVCMVACDRLVSHPVCILTAYPVIAGIGSVSVVTLSRIKRLLKMNGCIIILSAAIWIRFQCFLCAFYLLGRGFLIFSLTCSLKNKPIRVCPQGEIRLLHSWGRQWDLLKSSHKFSLAESASSNDLAQSINNHHQGTRCSITFILLFNYGLSLIHMPVCGLWFKTKLCVWLHTWK